MPHAGMALTVSVCLRLATWCSSHLVIGRHRRRTVPTLAGRTPLRRRDRRKQHVKVPYKRPPQACRPAIGLRTFSSSNCRALSPSNPREKIMIPVESRLLEELRNCAVELRQLAYTLQNGIGEHDLLRLSERMRATADEVVRSGI